MSATLAVAAKATEMAYTGPDRLTTLDENMGKITVLGFLDLKDLISAERTHRSLRSAIATGVSGEILWRELLARQFYSLPPLPRPPRVTPMKVEAPTTTAVVPQPTTPPRPSSQFKQDFKRLAQAVSRVEEMLATWANTGYGSSLAGNMHEAVKGNPNWEHIFGVFKYAIAMRLFSLGEEDRNNKSDDQLQRSLNQLISEQIGHAMSSGKPVPALTLLDFKSVYPVTRFYMSSPLIPVTENDLPYLAEATDSMLKLCEATDQAVTRTRAATKRAIANRQMRTRINNIGFVALVIGLSYSVYCTFFYSRS